jgi:exopolyphosphatase/guanosine-5'-triphosphate,3'-diphosphate pyrophosphatase
MKTRSQEERRAVIDVGTNSVKLLVADAGRRVRRLLKLSRQTRLGQGAFGTRRLRPEAIARTATAVAELAMLAAEWQPACIRVLATRATRETDNGDELVQAIRRAARLNVEIISGEQEAQFVFRGVTSERALVEGPLLIVDISGGSTEWVVGEGGFLYFTASTLLGTARLIELHPPSDPPTPAELALCRATVTDALHWDVRPNLQVVLDSFCGRAVRLVGLGGALKTLARLGGPWGSAANRGTFCLQLEQIRQRIDWLWSLSSLERRRLEGLDPGKADVILTGAIIYEAVMSKFNFSELFVSQRGLREGALLTGAGVQEGGTPGVSSGPGSAMSGPGSDFLTFNGAPIKHLRRIREDQVVRGPQESSPPCPRTRSAVAVVT